MKTYNPICRIQHWKYISPKRDGIAVTLIWDGNACWAKTKTTDITCKVLYQSFFREFQKACQGQPAITFSGELWLPGYDNTQVKPSLSRGDSRIRFDVWGSDSLPLGMTFNGLEMTAKKYGLSTVGWTPVMPEMTADSLLALCDKEIEGWVFADGNMRNYTKLKPVKTADVVVDRVERLTNCWKLSMRTADGHYLGLVTCPIINYTFKKGDIVEVEFFCLSKNNLINNANLTRIRDDKAVADTLDTIKNI